ncbi:MAG: A/G-specific adenine glycosylase [Gammaproteobacteria bacterium]|nr:A/G-specific adenine glycosylase [Gammaproteobacteria bacterium]MDE0251522.1 A/G-specific adenine glycosylase [Gammaproteobacteria bacterium]MDE0403468.1 A/G-specific adenine glycosylase [Gammaproteobacteria bacterium]
MTWFAERIVHWGREHGRTNLTWQRDRTPYRVWIAEIMLQQTQVATVTKYYDRFLQRFPTIATLAKSKQDEVLAAWHGLGYYRRALNIHATAKRVMQKHEGELPRTVQELEALPGIGRSTAGAILSLAYQIPAPILDGNVRRILARFHGVNGPPTTHIPDRRLWQIAAEHTPSTDCRNYTQFIMDFGALLCTRTKPKCEQCPVHEKCIAYQNQETHLFPAKRIAKTKHDKAYYLVVFTDDDKVLLNKRDQEGTFALLWDTPELNGSETLEPALAALNLNETKSFHQLQFTVEPYSISNKIVTETVFVAKYSVQAAKLGTPPNMQWFAMDELSTIGISVKARHRIELALTQGGH